MNIWHLITSSILIKDRGRIDGRQTRQSTQQYYVNMTTVEKTDRRTNTYIHTHIQTMIGRGDFTKTGLFNGVEKRRSWLQGCSGRWWSAASACMCPHLYVNACVDMSYDGEDIGCRHYYYRDTSGSAYLSMIGALLPWI
ncbi:hypothetical protein WUBG_11227 [Wuchereria bancrofti]|uniref:Uncharacterized protein n=1 Tax=Wuchereria bancrofti TaxID=6293 RepID=J9ATS3_WUCBA|nr:hypothetical protein WUBG_11227 [Wuchereria bancrofti]